MQCAGVVFGVSLLAGFIYALVSAVRFAIRRPVTILEASAGWRERLAFWRVRGKDPALDAIVDGLEREPLAEPRPAPPPIVFAHDWSNAFPLRSAVGVTLGAYVSLYVAASLFEAGMRLSGYEWKAPAAMLLLLALPPVLGLAYFVRARRLIPRNRLTYQEALGHFLERRYDLAEGLLTRILLVHPDDVAVLYLLTHLFVRRNEYDNALRCCRRLDKLIGKGAQKLAEDIWIVRRVYESHKGDAQR